ncbi:hypothetical protein JOD96_001835 [Flavobacterium sp. 1355]|nr:hypothetical protein [Flavobacterium sp. 1355]
MILGTPFQNTKTKLTNSIFAKLIKILIYKYL